MPTCEDPEQGCPCPVFSSDWNCRSNLGCGGCCDYPGGYCQFADNNPQTLVLGFPGELADVFLYQQFTRWLVHSLPTRARFEWVEAHWKTCRTNRFCTSESQGSNHSYRTCMKMSALRVLHRVRAHYPKVTSFAMIGHSAGTTAMLELLADGHLPSDWTVDRMVFMAPGAFRNAADAFNDTAKRALAQRAARDGTRAVAVYGSQDFQSAPAAQNIARFWDALRPANSSMAPFLNCGNVPWPGADPHNAVQDNKHYSQEDFLEIAGQVLSVGWGDSCSGGPTAPPTPVPPEPPGGWRFHCDTVLSKCVAAVSGHSSMTKCLEACNPPSRSPLAADGAAAA